MKHERIQWKSTNLGQDMEILTYGIYGLAILLFPSTTDDPEENEKNGLIDALAPMIDRGKCKVFCVPSVNFQSWLSDDISPEEKSLRHLQYNNYLVEEVVPFIFGDCGCPVPIITCGAALGAFHAANSFFRRPDVFYGMVATSGTYNIEHFTKGYFDNNCYFNSPIHYLPNLNDNYWLSFLLSKHHIYIVSGTGEGEHPHNALHLGGILSSKGIPHQVDIWGPEWGHNFNTWNSVIPQFIERKF